MPKIKIFGADYKAAFESAQSIIASGMLTDEMADCYIDSMGCIHNGNNVFEFIDSDAFRSDSAESDFRLTENGANWFNAVRNPMDASAAESTAAGAHLWEEFLSDLSRKYHDKYFLVACKRRLNESKHSDDGKNPEYEIYKTYAENVINTFYPNMPEWEFSEVFDENDFDNIYGLSLRLQIGTGGEKEIPVLGTLYFKQLGKRRMIPLLASDAEKIESSFTDIPEKDDYSSHLNRDIDATLNSLNNLFSEFSRVINEDQMGDVLADCILFDPTDEKSIQSLLSRIQNDNKLLVCKQVEILGITHVTWEKYTFVISDKKSGRDLFSVIGGVDQKLLMSCISCEEDADLIISNRITLKHPETNQTLTFTVDPSDPNLGLENEDINLIKANSAFAEHHISIGSYCGTPRNDKKCSQTRCKNDIISLDTPAGPMNFCKDCPYPEVVYQAIDGVPHYAPSLVFNTDTLRLDTPENVTRKSCVSCGRNVTTLHSDMFCELCATAIAPTAADVRVGEENYKKYSSMLPLKKRLLGKSQQRVKLCFEDKEILLFVIGDKKYVFHKFWLDNHGRKPSPHIVNT